MRILAGIVLAPMLFSLLISGCSAQPPMASVPQVDLHRFMGDWYVVAAIPTRFERHAYNAVESYALRQDGRIQTTFRYRQGGFDGVLKTMHPIGSVRPGTGNAVWSMQFVWPFKAEYVIAWLDPGYRFVIIGRSKRDYVWVMARTPQIAAPFYDLLTLRVASLGYDPTLLRRVPQQWPEPSP